MIGLEAASRYSDLPAVIVIIDSLILPSSEALECHLSFAAHLADPASGEGLGRFAQTLVLRSENQHDRDDGSAGVAEMNASAVGSAWNNALIWDDAAAICRTPLFSADSGLQTTNLAHLKRLWPPLVTNRSALVGHVHEKRVPKQMYSVIDRFLTILTRDDA